MRDPFDAQPQLVNSGRQSSGEITPPKATASSRGYAAGNGDTGVWTASSDALVRHQGIGELGAVNAQDEVGNSLMDPELTELLNRSRMQEEQLMLLRKQVADACSQELQLLKEKHVLERRLVDLRMAMDERQDDAISNALKDLSHRKGYVEENIRLAHDLQIEEEEAYIFTSSLLSLLADCDIRLPLLNASTIANNTKRLYHNMEWKIRAIDASLDHRKHLLGNHPGDIMPYTDRQPPNFPKNQLSQPHTDSRTSDSRQYSPYLVDPRVELTPNQSRLSRDYDMMDMKRVKDAADPDLHYRAVDGNTQPNFHEDSRIDTSDAQFRMPNPHERDASFDSEGELSLPGIELFQIIGEAKPGSTLRACGYPTNGTSLCIFQWFHHLENGIRQPIEGATVPEYVVTADDVDKFLTVDCIPIDDSGRQGDLVSLFANNHSKIACDPEMQHEIEIHMSTGRAMFRVFLLMDSSEAWEQTVLLLKRTNYQVKLASSDQVVVEEKYSRELYVKVPQGESTQFVLISSNGITLPFRTSGVSPNPDDDIRLRDIVVLTLRYFQVKAVDGKRKGKA